jgi:Rrf2 family protein
MQLPEGVEWTVHCTVLLAVVPEGVSLSGQRLAEFHGLPQAYLVKHLQSLVRAGILRSTPGARGGYSLARPPSEITVLDIVEATDGARPVFRCTEIRRRGPAALPAAAYTLPCSIHAVMDRAEAAWREELRATTVLDLVEAVAASAPPEAAPRAAAWLQEVMR